MKKPTTVLTGMDINWDALPTTGVYHYYCNIIIILNNNNNNSNNNNDNNDDKLNES